jgi:hypothetical protein
MARWRLVGEQAAYLKTDPPSIYTIRETDVVTGKTAQKVFEVPTEVPPGSILALAEGFHQDTDIIFSGDPTPDMYPLDEEAKAITAAMEQRWGQQFLGLEGNYSDTIGRQIADLFTDIRSSMPIQPSPVASPSNEVMELRSQVAELASVVKALLAERKDDETSGVQVGAIIDSQERRGVEQAGGSHSRRL